MLALRGEGSIEAMDTGLWADAGGERAETGEQAEYRRQVDEDEARLVLMESPEGALCCMNSCRLEARSASVMRRSKS